MTIDYKLDTYELSEDNTSKISEEIKSVIKVLNILNCFVSLDISMQYKMDNIEKVSMKTENIEDIKLFYSSVTHCFVLYYKNMLFERYLELPFNSSVCFDFVDLHNEELVYSRNCYISNIDQYEELELEVEENEE